MKSKKAMSGVVATIILILIVLVAAGIVWGIVNNLITKSKESSESCFGIFEKVNLNHEFTCYEPAAPSKMSVSISVGDIDVEKVMIYLLNKDETKTGTLDSPDRNSGKTVDILMGEMERPTIVKIAPVVNGETCEISDSLTGIDLCQSLA